MGRRRMASVAMAMIVLGGVTACSDDGDDAATTTTVPESTDSLGDLSATTVPPETGDIDVPAFPGTFPVAVPSLGFGLGVPEGWQATLLNEEAIERLEGATLEQPSFLTSATALRDSGALFYAAGIDNQGRVAELKVFVDDDASTVPADVRAQADAIIATQGLPNASITEGDGRVRIDYRTDGATADGAAVSAYGSQLLVIDNERLWSVIVTSEDQDTQNAVLTIVDGTITFDP